MSRSVSGRCQKRGATSITTWYWLSGVYMIDDLALAEGVVERVVDELRA